MDEELEELEPIFNARTIAIGVATIAVIGAILGCLYWLLFSGEENPLGNDVPISAEEQTEIKTIAAAFLDQAGTFGVKTEELHEDNVYRVSHVLTLEGDNLVQQGQAATPGTASNNPASGTEPVSTVPENVKASVDTFFTRRAKQYKHLRDLYIEKDSPLWYENSAVLAWNERDDLLDMMSYKIEALDVSVPDHATPIHVFLNRDPREEDRELIAKVDVSYASKQTKRTTGGGADDTAGAFDVESRIFANEPMTLLMIRNKDNKWKVYGYENFKQDFLFVTWADPANKAAFSSIQKPWVQEKPLIPKNPPRLEDIMFKPEETLKAVEELEQAKAKQDSALKDADASRAGESGPPSLPEGPSNAEDPLPKAPSSAPATTDDSNAPVEGGPGDIDPAEQIGQEPLTTSP